MAKTAKRVKTKAVKKVAPKAKATAPTTARQTLRIIERVLLRQNKEAAKLWNIMAALRGPDDNSTLGKHYTIRVRREAFPKIAAQDDKSGSDLPGDFDARLPDDAKPMAGEFALSVANRMSLSTAHFRGHIRYAEHALGISIVQ